MTLKDDNKEKEESMKGINNFLKEHFYGKRVNRASLTSIIRKK